MEGNYNNLFNYKILYSKKRKRTIGYKIVDNTMVITSPYGVKSDFLMNSIERKKYWAIERIEKNKNKKDYINQNSIIFLGKEIQINIKESELLSNGGYCELNDNILNITISKNYTQDILRNTIKNWYKKQCLNIIIERVKFYSEKYNLKYSKITIKEQKTVWGTCNYKNDLTFNFKILMFNLNVIDYLVVHELSHTIYRNHSQQYWNMVEKILPNYKELDSMLKNYKIS